jgi:hypothetical protein
MEEVLAAWQQGLPDAFKQALLLDTPNGSPLDLVYRLPSPDERSDTGQAAHKKESTLTVIALDVFSEQTSKA